MRMYSIGVKWRMRIVSATARGVTAAGRTTAGTDIVDGTKFLKPLVLLYYYLSDNQLYDGLGAGNVARIRTGSDPAR